MSTTKHHVYTPFPQTQRRAFGCSRLRQLAAALHHGEHVVHARQQLHELLRDLVADAARDRLVRDDVPADELASYCLHALAAARSATSQPAVDRLVNVALASLRARTSPE